MLKKYKKCMLIIMPMSIKFYQHCSDEYNIIIFILYIGTEFLTLTTIGTNDD